MQKKALVVTVYNSENCGSFLQAFAMQKTLQKLGYEVTFLNRDTRGTSHDITKRNKSIWSKLKHLHLLSAFDIYKQWKTYENLQQQAFNVVTLENSYIEKTDIVILGSDTIWNFEDEYFSNHIEQFLGVQFKGKNIVTYAVSLGNTSSEAFQKAVNAVGDLNHIKHILVRDSYSQTVIKSTFNRDSQIVCDPTLLLQPRDFKELYVPAKIKKKYILLYFFGEVTTKIKSAVIEYAKSHDLKIASLLIRRNWCDYYIPSSPSNMVTYFEKASVVLTNTFHGCALSLIYQKNFAAHDEGKIKVKEILKTYQASDHLFSDVSMMCSIFDKEPNNQELVLKVAQNSLSKLKEII